MQTYKENVYTHTPYTHATYTQSDFSKLVENWFCFSSFPLFAFHSSLELWNKMKMKIKYNMFFYLHFPYTMQRKREKKWKMSIFIHYQFHRKQCTSFASSYLVWYAGLRIFCIFFSWLFDCCKGITHINIKFKINTLHAMKVTKIQLWRVLFVFSKWRI